MHSLLQHDNSEYEEINGFAEQSDEESGDGDVEPSVLLRTCQSNATYAFTEFGS
jgi:hypothetical protein